MHASACFPAVINSLCSWTYFLLVSLHHHTAPYESLSCDKDTVLFGLVTPQMHACYLTCSFKDHIQHFRGLYINTSFRVHVQTTTTALKHLLLRMESSHHDCLCGAEISLAAQNLTLPIHTLRFQ